MALGIISVEYCSWRKLGAEKIRSCLTRKDVNPALQTPLSPVAGRSHDDHQDQHDNWAGEVCWPRAQCSSLYCKHGFLSTNFHPFAKLLGKVQLNPSSNQTVLPTKKDLCWYAYSFAAALILWYILWHKSPIQQNMYVFCVCLLIAGGMHMSANFLARDPVEAKTLTSEDRADRQSLQRLLHPCDQSSSWLQSPVVHCWP